jgi:hypothetical protein
MADEEAPKGKIEMIGEVFQVDIQDEEVTRQRFETDPHGTIRSFLESQGYKVNHVKLSNTESMPSYMWHIKKGPRASEWMDMS